MLIFMDCLFITKMRSYWTSGLVSIVRFDHLSMSVVILLPCLFKWSYVHSLHECIETLLVPYDYGEGIVLDILLLYMK